MEKVGCLGRPMADDDGSGEGTSVQLL